MPSTPTAPDSAAAVTRLIPTPQRMSSADDPVRFGSISLDAEADCSTSADLLAELTRHDASAGPTLSVVVGSDPDGLAWRTAMALAPEITLERPKEGYLLVVGGPANSPTAVIAGSDPAGAYYGTHSLLALIDDDEDGHWLPQVVIHDWPDLEWRGTIEGFYGSPWSHADRLAHLRFAGRHKLNTYVYAPKDDPYHRKLWREPYPAEELAQLGELVALADRSHVRFVFSISPGLSMIYSDPVELGLLLAKMEQVWEVGVRDFALLFDDIPLELAHAADIDAAGSAPGASARAHAAVCRHVLEQYLRPKHPDRPLIMVPTDYAGTEASPYRDHLARDLPEDVLVWWTGRNVVVSGVAREEIDAAAESYGHRLLLWDNFPVNDFDFSRLFLGPLTGRTSKLTGSALAGITANPMPHEAASEIAVATVADWAWNPGDYEPLLSHERALESVHGARAVRMLVRACSSWPPSAPQYPELSTLTDAALNGNAGEREAAVKGLTRMFAAMADGVPSGEPASRLEREVAPWLTTQAAMGRAGLAALDVLASPSDAGVEIAKQALVEAEARAENVLKDVVLPFVAEALKRAGAPHHPARPGAPENDHVK